METLLILRFARVRKLRANFARVRNFDFNHKSEITRADTWLLTQNNMSSNTYVHMKFESVLSAPIHTVHSRTCRRACPCQKNLHENQASHIEVLTRSPRFLYTKWSSKNDDGLNTAFSIERRRLTTKMGIREPPDFPSGLTMDSSRLHIYTHIYNTVFHLKRGFPFLFVNPSAGRIGKAISLTSHSI